MYNLLVSGNEHAWEGNYYQFDRSRFLEYTNDTIASAFRILTASHIQSLLSYPCIFAYEGKIRDVFIGRLTSVIWTKNAIEFEFVLDHQIPFASIEPALSALDIRRWEINRTHWAIKEVDLFRTLRDFGIPLEPTASHPSVTPTASLAQEPNDVLPTLAPAEFTVSSVGAFIERVLFITRDLPDSEVFYRGHSARQRYKLIPSLFRQDDAGNYLYLQKEDVIFRELLVTNFTDFSGDGNTLDKLVRMQHYSLPTRLLDITLNPLIALYFSCRSNLNDEGEVILFGINRNNIKYFDSDTVSCIANLACLVQTEKDRIDWTLDGNAFNEQTSIKRLLHFIKAEKPFFENRIIPSDLKSIVCVKGKRTNSRISSQMGAFLLYGAEAVLSEDGSDSISIKRIAIQKKDDILKELDLLNINESTVFPYIENSAKYIAEKYKIRNA